MTVKKGHEGKWRQATVVIREDIFIQAQTSGLDISDLCNRALAAATSIPYPPTKTNHTMPTAPVIIAHDGKPVKGETIPVTVATEEIRPVINADDPKAVTTVKRVQGLTAQRTPEALPGRISSPDKRPEIPAVPSTVPSDLQPGKPKSRPEKKGKTKESPIKKFVAGMIIREDADESHVTKEILYQAFTRWCREHRVTQIPDRKALTVALKNKFAIKEKAVDGESTWVNIRLR